MNFTDQLNVRLSMAVGAETFHKLTTENLFRDWLNMLDWDQLQIEFPKDLVEQTLAKGIDTDTVSNLVKEIEQYYLEQYKKNENDYFQEVAKSHEAEMAKKNWEIKS